MEWWTHDTFRDLPRGTAPPHPPRLELPPLGPLKHAAKHAVITGAGVGAAHPPLPPGDRPSHVHGAVSARVARAGRLRVGVHGATSARRSVEANGGDESGRQGLAHMKDSPPSADVMKRVLKESLRWDDIELSPRETREQVRRLKHELGRMASDRRALEGHLRSEWVHSTTLRVELHTVDEQQRAHSHGLLAAAEQRQRALEAENEGLRASVAKLQSDMHALQTAGAACIAACRNAAPGGSARHAPRAVVNVGLSLACAPSLEGSRAPRAAAAYAPSL